MQINACLLLLMMTANHVRCQDSDVKAAIKALDTKVDGLKEKLQSLNFMEYAFKMTNFDNTLKSIATNVELITKKMAEFEKQLTGSVGARSSSAPQAQPQQQQQQNPAFQKKMEEYGEKMLSVQHSLVTEVKKHAELSGGVKALLENGVNKMLVKLDSLLGLQATGTSFQQVVENVADIKNTILATTVGSNSTAERINELYNALKGDWASMEKELSGMKAILSDVSRLNNVTEMVQGARTEEVQAVIAKLRKDVSQLQSASTAIKNAEVTGSELVKIVGTLGNSDAIEMTKNLTVALANFNSLHIPLVGAVDGGFQLMTDILERNVTIGASKTLPFMCGGLRFLSMDVTKMERVLSERLQTVQNSLQCSAPADLQKNLEQIAKNIKCPTN